MNAYSEDLRQKIVQALQRGISKSQAARLFDVSLSSIKRYDRIARRGESLKPRKGSHRVRHRQATRPSAFPISSATTRSPSSRRAPSTTAAGGGQPGRRTDAAARNRDGDDLALDPHVRSFVHAIGPPAAMARASAGRAIISAR